MVCSKCTRFHRLLSSFALSGLALSSIFKNDSGISKDFHNFSVCPVALWCYSSISKPVNSILKWLTIPNTQYLIRNTQFPILTLLPVGHHCFAAPHLPTVVSTKVGLSAEVIRRRNTQYPIPHTKLHTAIPNS